MGVCSLTSCPYVCHSKHATYSLTRHAIITPVDRTTSRYQYIFIYTFISVRYKECFRINKATPRRILANEKKFVITKSLWFAFHLRIYFLSILMLRRNINRKTLAYSINYSFNKMISRLFYIFYKYIRKICPEQ